MIELVVFDMSGTTVADDGHVVAAFQDALRDCQVSVTEADLQPWRGASKRQVLRVFVEGHWGVGTQGNDQRVEDAYAAFRSSLEAAYAGAGVRPIPGAESTFDWLRGRGIKIALTTGFYRRVADIILVSLGWMTEVIDASVCSDDVARGRPAPDMILRAMGATGVADPRRVAKVGDTVLDLEAGQSAGAGLLVGVLTGSGTREQLEAVERARVVPGVPDLPPLLATWTVSEPDDC